MLKRLLYWLYSNLFSLFVAPVLIVLSFISRFFNKKYDIGIGPEPIVSHKYHKQALENSGYSVETFVISLSHISDQFDKLFINRFPVKSFAYYLTKTSHFYKLKALLYVLFHYKALYFYFHGGVIGFLPGFMWELEPLMYRLAGIKTVVMPYGSDIQEMSRSNNLLYKHYLSIDYPAHRFRRKLIEKKIDLWTTSANCIVSGVEWVDYMYYWDVLMLGHFAIDTDQISPDKKELASSSTADKPFIVFHAPNHAYIKGTLHLERAINKLKKEDFNIELNMLQKVNNNEVLNAIKNADLVADQFIIGWYAMFAIEAMALGKPVLCYLRPDLVKLYEDSLLVSQNEIPIVNCSVDTIYEQIKLLYNDRSLINEIGKKSREFVVSHHSLDAIGKQFSKINQSIGL